jgi:hypothetical protein
LREIGAAQNSTVVFPMPIDLVKPVLEAMGGAATGAVQPSQERQQELDRGDSRQLGRGADDASPTVQGEAEPAARRTDK